MWTSEWNAISARIKGLLEAGKLWALTSAVNSGEAYRPSQALLDEALSIFDVLKLFRDSRANFPPSDADRAIARFIQKNESLFSNAETTKDGRMARAQGVLVRLSAFDGELSFLLTDRQEVIKRLTDRAFIHLQQCIVADAHIRSRWQEVFEVGETPCERLGAAHLLGHGIWAFKAHAEGARTDLVLGQPAERWLTDARRSSEGMVLTEWKRARDDDEAGEKFAEARRQSVDYVAGTLAGFELSTCRYAVVVTRTAVPRPEDLLEGEVTWRHINIAVYPETPSVAARRTRSRPHAN